MSQTEKMPAFQANRIMILGIIVLALFTAAAIFIWGPLMSFVIIAGGIFSLGAMSSLKFGLMLLLGLVILFQRAELFMVSIPFWGGGIKPTDVLLIAILMGWLLRGTLGRARKANLPTSIFILILSLVIWSAISAILGISREIFYKDALAELRPILQYLLIFPIVSELNLQKMRKIIWSVLVFSIFSSIYGIYLYSEGIGAIASYTRGGLRVTDICFAHLVFAILLAIIFLLEGIGRGIFLIPIILLNLSALALTFQRSAWLGMGCGLVFLYFASERKMKKKYLSIAGVAVLVGFIAHGALALYTGREANILTDLMSRMASIGEYKDDVSAQHRLEEWKEAYLMFLERPIIGNGLGSRVRFYSPMYSEESKKMGTKSEDFYVHNSYIWFGVKMGLIGLFIFMGIVTVVLYQGIKVLKQETEGKVKGELAGLLACLVAAIIFSFFGPIFNVDNLTPSVAFILGSILLLTLSRRELKKDSTFGLDGRHF